MKPNPPRLTKAKVADPAEPTTATPTTDAKSAKAAKPAKTSREEKPADEQPEKKVAESFYLLPAQKQRALNAYASTCALSMSWSEFVVEALMDKVERLETEAGGGPFPDVEVKLRRGRKKKIA